MSEPPPPATVRGRRGAVSAAVISEEDAASYVKKVKDSNNNLPIFLKILFYPIYTFNITLYYILLCLYICFFSVT